MKWQENRATIDDHTSLREAQGQSKTWLINGLGLQILRQGHFFCSD